MQLTNVNSNQLLATLNEFMADASKANALNTTTAQVYDLKAYQEYCVAMDVNGFPADGKTIASYVRWMKAKGWAYSTIRRRISTVSVYHKAANLADPAHDGQRVSIALKEVRNASKEPVQAPPMRQKDLDGVLLEIKQEKYETVQLRNKALVMLAYDTLMRRSELANVKLSDFEQAQDGENWIVKVIGKTNDVTTPDYRFVKASTYDAIMDMIDFMGLADGGFIFRKVRFSKVFGKLNEQDPYTIMKKYGFTGHSARVGAALDQRAAGLSVPEICQSGGWSSEAVVLRYTKKIDVMNSGSAKLAKRTA